MNRLILTSRLTLATLLFLPAQLPAQSPAPRTDLRGVWQGTLDGMPGVTLTLANDTGQIGGTVVFYGVNGKEHRIVVVQPHVLLHPNLEGQTLSFQIQFSGDRQGLARVEVVFTDTNKARLHCLDCGADSPIAELTRQTS